MAGMKNPIFRDKLADYIKIGKEFEVMKVYNQIDENPSAKTKETHYTSQKTSTKTTIGYAPSFPITGDMYSSERTSEFFRDIGEEQKIGSDCETEYLRVRLYEPIAGKDNTCYARLFRVAVEITGITGAGGEHMVITGNLNSLDDVVIGEFNTETKTFTSKADLGPIITKKN
ncbi:MAG: hypothetical protein RSB96_01670 [Oscillospiraceae bacterium]